MRIPAFFLLRFALLMPLTAPAFGAASAQQDEPTAGAAAELNLAVVAVPSSSYVSGDTTLQALQDGYDPRNSQDARRGSYGNWNRTGTQWVEYDWSQPISTRKIDVYWWADRRGVHAPKVCRVLYWDGTAFVPVSHPSGLGVAEDQYNTTTFDEVRTAKLRLEIDSDGNYSTGILEWKVYDSGQSPPFPPTVAAGLDRVVMLGGKTYLAGKVKTLQPEGTMRLAWSKESGPGSVTFEQASAADTTATVSAPGQYRLKLTARQGQLSASSSLSVKVDPPPPADHLDPVPPGPFKIDNPLWNNRVKALIVHWIPHCIDRIADPDLREGGINNLVAAANKLAGKPHERHRGYVFANAWVFNTVEAICLALMVDPQGDPEISQAQATLKATLEDWIPKILAAQEPDGYFQTAYTLSGRERWTRRGDHEGYVAGYFLDSAVAHYRLTRGADRRLYEAARRLANCWDANLGPPPKKYWYDGHQAMEMALVRFGRFVNEVEGAGHGQKYIKLAKFLLDCRRDGQKYDQSHLPVIQQYEAVGHAVRAVYSYTGMADVALETGDIEYESAVQSLWNDIVHKKYYLTGGVGSGETSEGFGPDYSLRNNAYCESCSSCGEIFFQHALNLIHHDAKYADLYEETLYNALLGSVDLAGQNFYYQNPLDARSPRYPWHGCPCCVGNIPRTLLMLPTWTYVKGPDRILVNLFIGSTMTIPDVAGTDVQLVQTTDFPWSGQVTITVNPKTAARFTVGIRVPDRDVSHLYTATPNSDGISSISVNGAQVTPTVKKGYATITRSWQGGDRIDLLLPMKVQRVKASEKVAADRGRVALRYGPLIYNAEAADQDITQVLDPDSALSAEWRGDLLGGVMILKGTWADGSPLTAIPNYARMNRGPATPSRRRGAPRSIVWLRDR